MSIVVGVEGILYMNLYLAILLRGRETVNPGKLLENPLESLLTCCWRVCILDHDTNDNSTNGGGESDNQRATRGKRMATTITLRVKAT